MRILSLEISNILSIESASLSFEDNGLVLVEGWNYDTGRANGAGKTAIFNCLSFALYDKLPRKITASEILRRGSKSGFVKCNVVCGEDTWTVERSRPRGVKFFKNGLEQTIAQDEFESKIRLSYDQFLLTIYTAQSGASATGRFLTSPDGEKKTFLLHLLNLEAFSSCKSIVDEKIKSLNDSLLLENSKLSSIASKISAYKESLVDVDTVNKSIADLDKMINLFYKEIQELSNVSKPDLSKYFKLEDDARDKLAEILQAKAKRSMLNDEYRNAQSNVSLYAGESKCPECGADRDITQAKAAHEQHQDKLKQKLSKLKQQIDECDAIITKEIQVNEVLRKLRDKKNSESSAYDEASKRIIYLKSMIQNRELQVENARLKLVSDSELRNKINKLDANASITINYMSIIKQDLEFYKTLSSIYSPTGAQAYVLDSIVDSFNEVVQKYVDIMWPNASYLLNSYKETSKGDIVAKFSETLTLDGKEVSVGSLSGGELKGLSLCVDFALLDVLETQFGLSLNPIILDEPFDGLDMVGREVVIGLLEQIARNRQIFIIDHTSEAKTMFSKSILVEKRAGISTVHSHDII